MSVSYMSDEARRYYEGGKRKMINGVPCRVPAWRGQKTGADAIAKLVASGAAIEPGDLPAAPSFRFVPADNAPLHRGKPSARGTYTYRARHKSSWWKPASISLAPYAARSLTDTPADLESARNSWTRFGNPEPLREWLADTADERRATWAAIDACNAVASFARALAAAPRTPVYNRAMLSEIDAGRRAGLFAKPTRLAA